ncbi:MAG: ribonuclease H-like domain-containing protein, partial [Vicinamibacteria bacterium]
MIEKARILLFDIEATALNASFGHTLCVGYKYLGDKRTKVISLFDYPTRERKREPDERLMRRVHEIITNEADILISFYGKEYDRKFLNTRMLMAGLPPLPPLSSEHIDLYFTARGNLRLHSGRLQAVSESIGCPMTKSPVRADIWRYANRGDRKAMR